MVKKYVTLNESLLKAEAQVFADGSTSEAKELESFEVGCKNPFYPYDESGDFVVSLKAGENEITFDTEDHYNSFIVAVTNFIMNDEIIVCNEPIEAEATTKTSSSKSKKSSK